MTLGFPPGGVIVQASRLGDDRGQDLIEYALIAAFVGLAGLLALHAMAGSLAAAYGAWNARIQNLWVPPAPGGGQ